MFKLAVVLLLLSPLALQSCLPHYQYIDPYTSTCLPCHTSCKTCFNSTYCLQCNQEFYLAADQTCSKCTFGCKICLDGSSCSSCNDGLYLTNSGECQSCSDGVQTCTIATVQTCSQGFFLLSSICAGCVKNCKTCKDFVTCQDCMLGYYLSSNSSSCLACSANCQVCTDNSVCTLCAYGYTQNGGACQTFSCASFDSFCASCSPFQCLSCKQGNYLSGGRCFQGSSLLCLEASGEYHTKCQTASNGCQHYSLVQSFGGTQMPVCLPFSATKTQQSVYLSQPIFICSTCSSPTILTLSYQTSQAYYQVSYYFRLKLYTNKSRIITIASSSHNGTALASQIVSVDTSAQFTAFNKTDSSCSGCLYVEKTISGQMQVSGGQFDTNFTLSDNSGLLGVIQAIFLHSICQVAHCKQCTSAVDCYGCFEPYYLQLSACVSACDSGFYLLDRICYLQCPQGTYTVRSSYSCLACISPCLTCSNSTICLSCQPSYYLEGTSCLKTCSSLSLFANATTLKCQPCPNPCILCNLTTNNTILCLSCQQGYLLSNGSCSYFCPWGSFGNFNNGITQCLTCASQCTHCSLTDSVCFSCSTGYLLIGSTCTHNTTCLAGFYQDISAGNICSKCRYPCQTCQNSSSLCRSCQRGSLHNNSCLNTCPNGYFSDYNQALNITCQICEAPCLLCVNSFSCISCQSGFYLYQSSCLSSCPDEYYASSSGFCQACLPPCKRCLNQSACLSCSTGYLDNATCTLECNSSAFIASDFTCKLCPSPCLSCYSSTHCLQCSLPYLLFDHSCITVSTCNNQSGFYPAYFPNSSVATFGSCSACSFPCSTCQNNSVTCLSCPVSFYFLAQQNKCFSTCPDSYYSSAIFCLACDSNCYLCSISAVNCTACSSGRFLLTSNSSCTDTCPSGFYGDDITKNCLPCQSPCLTCLNVYLCSTCLVGIAYGTECVTTCPDSTYHNSTLNSCVICPNNCLTCSNASQCLACPNGFYLHNSFCLQSCPSLHYPNDFARLCQPCSSPCLNCSSSTACLSCQSGYYYFNYQCVTECESSYFADNTTKSCVSCNITICLTCVGSAQNCLSCNTGYYMQGSICMQICANMTYPDSNSAQCLDCPFSCLSCLNSTFCTSCQSSYNLFQNRCFSKCPTGYYSDSSSVCQTCQSLCQICTSAQVCVSCISGYYVFNNTCVASCPLSFYAGRQQITYYDHCLACPATCSNCSSSQICLSCPFPTIQFNGLCLNQCPIFYFNDSNSQCQQCSQYCTNCLNQTYCFDCIGSYLYQNSCYVSCPAATYAFSDVCMACKSPCFNCTGDFTCTSCQPGYIYFHNYCVLQCPSDVWYYPHNNSCGVTCPHNKHQATMTCYIGSCGKMMVALSGYCLEQCAPGHYVNLDSQCVSCGDSQQCDDLFQGNLEFLYMDVLKISLYLNQQAQLASFNDLKLDVIDIDSRSLSFIPTSHTITPYKIQLTYNYSSISLVNITLTIPYIRSLSSSQRISSNTFKKQLVSYHDYSQYLHKGISFLPTALILILFVLVVIGLVNKSSNYTQILDFSQLVAVTLYLDIQYPPMLQNFLQGFKTALFVFTENLVSIVPYRFSSPKFIHYHTDTSLFRNQMLLFLVFVVILAVFLIIIAINAFNPKRLVKAIKNIRYRLLNELYCICLTPLFLFACQIKYASPLDIFITILVLLLGVGYVTWISYKIVNVRKMSELPGLLGDFEKTQSKLGLLYNPFGFVRRIVFTLGLGIAPYYPISTLTLLLVFTFLIMICVYFYQPFENQYTDYVTIYMQISLTLYVLCLIIMALDVLKPVFTHYLGVFVIAIISLTMVICIAWVIYLTIHDIRTKGCCPQTKDQIEGKDDYSESNSKRGDDKAIQQMQKGNHDDRPEAQQDSANQMYRGMALEGNNQLHPQNGQQFRHWSQSQHVSESAHEPSLPHLLYKKEYSIKGKNEGQQRRLSEVSLISQHASKKEIGSLAKKSQSKKEE